MNSRRILAAFVLGQVCQIVMQIVANAVGAGKPILWASAAGFLIAFSVMMGICVGSLDQVRRK